MNVKEVFFNKNLQRLPSIEYLNEKISIKSKHIHLNPKKNWSFDKIHNTYRIRENYLNYLFPLINHEFLCDLGNVCSNYTNIVELNAGTGWFSWWMKKYGIDIKYSIDTKEWKFKKYMNHITKADSRNFIKEYNADLYILSWPYMDETATEIWNNMKDGSTLLYIGEGYDGCTALNSFFDCVYGTKLDNETKQLQQNFTSFECINDLPFIYRKT